ncbi:AMMECR 1 family protein [Senna tora]|uniref:AMMECR 1 family protein n=1 Tax=Senna tora TaxID=362788 RepID=A0A834SCP8_9FABA|nr:AMMECR 1 family protein [Senna tora]
MALCHRQPLTTTFGIVNLIIEVAVGKHGIIIEFNDPDHNTRRIPA